MDRIEPNGNICVYIYMILLSTLFLISFLRKSSHWNSRQFSVLFGKKVKCSNRLNCDGDKY